MSEISELILFNRIANKKIADLEHQLSATQAELEEAKHYCTKCMYLKSWQLHAEAAEKELEEAKKDHQEFGQRYDAMVQKYEEQLYDARANDRCSFNYLSAIRYAIDANADFPTLVEKASNLVKERDELRELVEQLENEAWVRKDRILEQRKENQSLRTECGRLKEEKALFADEMLRTLAGIVCTPVEGYNQGKFGWMLSDVRSLRKLAEQRESELAALRRALERIAELELNFSNPFDTVASMRTIASEALGMGEK